MRQRFLGGAAWTGASRFVVTIVGIGSTLVLGRLLEPADFGLLAMAVVFTGLADQFRDLGVGQALIQIREANLQAQQLAFTFALMTASGTATVLVVASPWIAQFYGDERLIHLIWVLALTLPISAFSVVPQSLMRRDLTLRGEASAQVAASVIGATVTIGLAIAGFGAYSLAVGRVVAALASSVGLSIARPWSARLRLRGTDARGMLRFGGGVSLSSLLWYGYSNADFLLVGRFLGSVSAGLYTMAWNLAKIPGDRLWAAINPLVMPAFSRARENPGQLGRALMRITHLTALLTIPLFVGLGLVADDAIPLLLGERWQGSIAPVRWLCGYGAVRSLFVYLGPILLATGRVSIAVRFNLVCFAVLPISIYIALEHGPAGVAAIWAIVYPVLALMLMLPTVLSETQLSAAQYLNNVLRPACAAAVMAAAVVGVRAFGPDLAALRLALSIAAGGAAYAIMLRWLEPALLGEFREIFGDARQGLHL